MFSKRTQKPKISESDGFPILETAPWYYDKIGIIQSYVKAYHQRFDLRNKNKMLVYIGAGPGLAISPRDEYPMPSTPLEILAAVDGFQRYIFCEKNTGFAKALKVRIGQNHSDKHTIIIEGDINETVDKLAPYLPEKIGKTQSAILCIIDVQSFDINFETMELLAALDVDFLLVNSYVHSAYYNYEFYLDEERENLNAYFGSSWARLAESAELTSDTSFFLLTIKAYLEQIKQLGYNVTGTLHKYNIEEALVPYYQIAYCTKSKVLKSLKQKMVKESSKQIELFG